MYFLWLLFLIVLVCVCFFFFSFLSKGTTWQRRKFFVVCLRFGALALLLDWVFSLIAAALGGCRMSVALSLEWKPFIPASTTCSPKQMCLSHSLCCIVHTGPPGIPTSGYITGAYCLALCFVCCCFCFFSMQCPNCGGHFPVSGGKFKRSVDDEDEPSTVDMVRNTAAFLPLFSICCSLFLFSENERVSSPYTTVQKHKEGATQRNRKSKKSKQNSKIMEHINGSEEKRKQKGLLV